MIPDNEKKLKKMNEIRDELRNKFDKEQEQQKINDIKLQEKRSEFDVVFTDLKKDILTSFHQDFKELLKKHDLRKCNNFNIENNIIKFYISDSKLACEYNYHTMIDEEKS